MRVMLAAAAAVLCATLAPAAAQAPSASPSPAPDYTMQESWLCLPGRVDACAADLTTTVVQADGTVQPEASPPAAADPPIDCFYVYPTVSNDPTPNSDMTANAEETNVIAQQFARFRSVCRTYAPLYRQVTLTALRAGLSGQPMPADRAMAFADVRAAWETYLATYNKGRGVILIGHSQGAGILTALVATAIDGKPVQQRIVSAMILGSNVAVPRGQTVGGVFTHMPLCTRADQSGCVVSYVSFRDTTAPPESSRFGTALTSAALPLPAGDMAAACVNPAGLLAGAAEGSLRAYLPARPTLPGAPSPEWATGKTIATPFVSTPGLLTAHCTTTPTHTYLSVHVNAVASDPRADDIPGDVIVRGQVQADWGLHLIDVNLEMGDLVALAARQGAAWRAAQR